MDLADEMKQLTKEYEDKFFDPELYKYIIKLIKIAAERGEYCLTLNVKDASSRYESLMRHLRNEGFRVVFSYGGLYSNGESAPNSLCIDWYK